MNLLVPASRRPSPESDGDSTPFWEGTRNHELRLQQCRSCGEVRFPPMPRCLECGSTVWKLVVVSPLGHIYSWIRVERPLGGLYQEEIPCVFVVVQLDSRCRMVGHFEGEELVEIGSPVVAFFVDWANWTEVRFRIQELSQPQTINSKESS